MRLIRRLFASPFALAVLGCLLLAVWALWSGGILDGPVARKVRSSSVYAAPGTGLDVPAAQRIIGNRRLVVALLEPGADLRQGCADVRHAADGTLVLMLKHDNDEYDTYGCARLPGVKDKNLGKALVAETTIGRGIDGLGDRPLEAVKVIAVNYDLLVKAGAVPDGARTISPSLPRYLIAAAAVLAVLLGSLGVYVGGRGAGRLAASRRAGAEAGSDARNALGAATAVLAQQIIDLDRHYSGRKPRGFAPRYRQVASDYTDLMKSITEDDTDTAALTERVEALSKRCQALTAAGVRP
jgi:hypothetical protein